MSKDGKAFAGHIKKVHEQVRPATTASYETSATTANQHPQENNLEEGDVVLVHVRRDRFLKGNYHELKSRKFGAHVRCLGKLAQMPICWSFHEICRLARSSMCLACICFEGFDGVIISTEEQFQLPDVVEDALDIKKVAS